MRQIVTTGIVLTRTDFQEADRIVTFLTPDHGKVRAMARGVRKIKSKLAGGIELFSISNITYIPGKGEISTLVSTRLKTHYGSIVRDINRTMLGYELLKRVNRITEDAAGIEYFELLAKTLEGLDDSSISSGIIELWFTMQLLKITGHTPNLRSDVADQHLSADDKYQFDFDEMAFRLSPQGDFAANQIKVLRLGLRAAKPAIVANVTDVDDLVPFALDLGKAILGHSVRI